MSTKLMLDARLLADCLSQLSSVFPGGVETIPVGLHANGSVLSINYVQPVVYQGAIPLSESVVVDTTILYFDIAVLLPRQGTISLEIENYGVTLEGDGFSCFFQTGYSSVDNHDFSGYTFQDMVDTGYVNGLKALLGLGFEKLYKQSKPINVYGDVAVLKYPSTYVQVRSGGLPFTAILSQDHVKQLLSFEPNAVSLDIKDSIILRHNTSFLQLPCKSNVPENNFLELMQDLGEPVTLSMEHYSDRVRNIAKASNKSDCKIVLYPNGIQTTVTIESSRSSVHIGDISGEPVKVFNYPMQVWLAFLKALGKSTAQFLVGGELLCLRTPYLIILTRVLQ